MQYLRQCNEDARSANPRYQRGEGKTGRIQADVMTISAALPTLTTHTHTHTHKRGEPQTQTDVMTMFARPILAERLSGSGPV